MTGCIYKLDDGRCDKPGRYKSPCIGEACEHQTPSNGDRIRAMSDKELARFLWNSGQPCCPPVNCAFNKCGADKCWLDWLKSPVEEVDNGD